MSQWPYPPGAAACPYLLQLRDLVGALCLLPLQAQEVCLCRRARVQLLQQARPLLVDGTCSSQEHRESQDRPRHQAAWTGLGSPTRLLRWAISCCWPSERVPGLRMAGPIWKRCSRASGVDGFQLCLSLR